MQDALGTAGRPCESRNPQPQASVVAREPSNNDRYGVSVPAGAGTTTSGGFKPEPALFILFGLFGEGLAGLAPESYIRLRTDLSIASWAMLARTISGPALVLAGIVTVLCCIAEARAKGGSYRMEDRYNPQHITSLPPDIRAAIYASCKEPRALHSFAEYRDNLRIVTLHFEHFLCGVSEVRCSASGCLHEVFTLTGNGRYKLLQRYFARDRQGP
jgi:hypothetical protein